MQSGAPDGNISETKRAIRDPLVSKQPKTNSEYEIKSKQTKQTISKKISITI